MCWKLFGFAKLKCSRCLICVVDNVAISHSKKTKESYNKNKNTIDILESGDTIVLSMNGVDGFTLPYEVDEYELI